MAYSFRPEVVLEDVKVMPFTLGIKWIIFVDYQGFYYMGII